MPEVWFSIVLIVIKAYFLGSAESSGESMYFAGNVGTYFWIGASNSIYFSCTNFAINNEVNIFDIDAIRNEDSGFISVKIYTSE